MATEHAAAAETTAAAFATNPASALNLNPTGFVDDLHNAVQSHCAAGFDELDSAVRSDLAAELSPEQLVVALQGTANLYQSLRVELNSRLQTFEQYALAESLKVPAGLMAPVAVVPGEEGGVSEEAEAEAEAALVHLRRQIAAAKQQGREIQAEEAELRRLIEDLGGKLRGLEAVPSALAGKENLIEDIKAIADRGVTLEAGCARLDSLREEQELGSAAAGGAGTSAGGGAEGMSDDAAEREILRRQQAMRSTAPDDLRKVRERLGME